MSSLFDWFANIRKTETPIQKQREREIADGLWTKCNSCGSVAYTKDFQANQLVCPECNYHNRVDSDERIEQLIDADETFLFDSYLKDESDLEIGELRLLEVDNRLVLPIQKHIRVIVTAADVLHC